MEIALDLARSREGLTGTNPSVGCVIVKNDNIISIGQTSYNGRPHAEFNAIKNCNEKLNGAKMYVTLEPCSHQGVTPPCTNEIIKSKISEVVYALEDTDKRVRKKSFKILKSHKINVSIGLLKDKVKKFYIPYFFNRNFIDNKFKKTHFTKDGYHLNCTGHEILLQKISKLLQELNG